MVGLLDNGNSITGEVKGLQQGKLQYKTDNAGTIYIEWDAVYYLTSSAFFEVEDEHGEFFYGSLGAAVEKQKLLVVDEGTVELVMEAVVAIQPIKKTFWQRIDGSIDLGLTYTSADSSLQFALDAKATYRQPKYSESITLSSMETRREIVTDLTVNLSARDSFDSDPPEDASAKHDLAVVLSVGWTF